jgi:uncharacterized protein YndB with AHSA1/START domain
MIEPIHLAFEVACPAARAFEIWTSRTSTWWPASHTVSGEPGLEVVFERRPGGRIFERTGAGREYDWGEILAWEPPRRLVYLWHLRADRTDATEVEITFTDGGPDRTIVAIEHRGWDRLGSLGQSRRDANGAGWAGLLPHFVATCAPASTSADAPGTGEAGR